MGPMRLTSVALCAGILLASSLATVVGQESQSTPPAEKKSPDASAKKAPDPEAELQKALANAGNDSAAMITNLKEYLREFPDSPRKAAVYRALVEACEQTHDTACALDFAERLIVTRPDDSQMMLVAVNLLEQRGDDASLARGAGEDKPQKVRRRNGRRANLSPNGRTARPSFARRSTTSAARSKWRSGTTKPRTRICR
jgi:hypothetical protein